jgi:hypothetical protein
MLMERFKSKFDKYESVLNFGFTDRDATPPNWERRKPINQKENENNELTRKNAVRS